jgi:hypothetical protein
MVLGAVPVANAVMHGIDKGPGWQTQPQREIREDRWMQSFSAVSKVGTKSYARKDAGIFSKCHDSKSCEEANELVGEYVSGKSGQQRKMDRLNWESEVETSLDLLQPKMDLSAADRLMIIQDLVQSGLSAVRPKGDCQPANGAKPNCP